MGEQLFQSNVTLESIRIQRVKAPVKNVQLGAFVPREDLKRLLLVPREIIAYLDQLLLNHVQLVLLVQSKASNPMMSVHLVHLVFIARILEVQQLLVHAKQVSYVV